MNWLRVTPSSGGLETANHARAALGWNGFTLPAVRMSGGAVLPVVAWTTAAPSRWRDGPHAEPDRATLAEWEHDGPPSAVRVLGFIHVGTPAAAIDRLKAVAGYGPGAVVVHDAARISAWTMAEADIAGLSVVEIHPRRGARVVLTGREGPATARRTVATRLREEQLFELALRVGHEPCDVPVTDRTLISRPG